ncbi:MAG TPA: J domain-containing protein [Ktedonobacteraceae bacterium]|jgi:WD40 repeat protein|nr:J domain-containing protein [Ktedonobacteraceae bacterium]
MDTPDNYYAILGVPIDADSDTLKRAYRQLARRYHPDLAGPEGAAQMKRINRAYDVLSDPEKRQQYDTITGGVIDLRKGGLTRPRPVQRKFDSSEDIEYEGLSIFSTRGPFHRGARLQTHIGVISALSSAKTPDGPCIAVGTLDGKGLLWQQGTDRARIRFAADPALTLESLREVRFSASGGLVAGWGRLGLHVWNTRDGSLLWSHALHVRAVSAHYSLDTVLQEHEDGTQDVWMALPLLRDDPLAPRSQGVRATDVVQHRIGTAAGTLSEPLICAEDEIEKRQFWAIRLRKLSADARSLLTLSCANVADEQEQMIVIRRWDLAARARFGGKLRPQITVSLMAGTCADCVPPYAVTPDATVVAFVSRGQGPATAPTGDAVRIYDTLRGTFRELNSGTMGASSRLAISPDAGWVAVAREDSEMNEGVIDLWSTTRSEIMQRFYHPWQISTMHFADHELVVALTDGTIQVWEG